jgi:hypothetical protein
LRRFLEACALNTAGVVDQRTLYEAAGIAKATSDAYEKLLRNLLVVEILPAWWSNRLKRLIRSPKRYLLDSALALASLRLDIKGLMADGDMLGRALDTLVMMQLRAEIPRSAGARWRRSRAKDLSPLVARQQAVGLRGWLVTVGGPNRADTVTRRHDASEPVGKPLAGSRRPASPLAALSSVDAQNQCDSLLRLAIGARRSPFRGSAAGRSLIDDGFTNRLSPFAGCQRRGTPEHPQGSSRCPFEPPYLGWTRIVHAPASTPLEPRARPTATSSLPRFTMS